MPRAQELEAMKAEFSGVQERTAKAAARWEARKKELEAKKEEEVVQEHFKANPVPKYLRKGNRAAYVRSFCAYTRCMCATLVPAHA